MANFERAPRQNDPFTPAALTEDIQKNIRPYAGFPEIGNAQGLKRDKLLKQYLSNVDQARTQTVEIAREQNKPLETLNLIQALFATEAVAAWTTNRFEDAQKNFEEGILRSVEWQNKIAAYMLEVDKKHDLDEQQKILSQFWKSYEEVLGSAAPGHRREKAIERARQFRFGILRPFAIGYALRHNNGWEVQTPPDPEDDAKLKVDLIAKTPDNFYFLIQSKPIDTPGFEFRNIEVNPENEPIDSKYIEFWNGIKEYAVKYDIPEGMSTGVFTHLTKENLNKITGVPDPYYSKTISESFSSIYKRQKNNKGY